MSCVRYSIAGLAAAVIVVSWWCMAHRSTIITPAVDSDWQSDVVKVAPGVTYRYFPEGSELVSPSYSDALVLDVDLSSPTVKLRVAADGPERRKSGKVFGVAHTVQEWCRLSGAVGGINGGFFGQTDGAAKQAEGLLVVDGKVYNSGRWVKSTRRPGESFLRCALGIGKDGSPHIGWATCQPDGAMLMFDRPLSPAGSRSFGVSSGLACGPRLVVSGKEQISDDKERLVSRAALPRTFVAYDTDMRADRRAPRHFVMGIAMQMTYHDVAKFLQNYFRSKHNSNCEEAMCLDGGSSSQLVYHAATRRGVSTADDWVDTRPSRVTVPTALLVTANTNQ